MILEIMQAAYVTPSSDVIQSLIADAIANEEAGRDPELRAMMRELEIEPADLKEALGRTEEAAAYFHAPTDEENAALFPRSSAAASHVQSLLEQFFLERGLIQRPPSSGAAEVIHPISDISLDESVRAPQPKRLFGKMSQSDARWIACWAAKLFRACAKRRPFPDEPADPVRIRDDARLFVIGDWGSGVNRAKKVADRIKVMLAETDREQHVIHLGDVYYSGWPGEYDNNFFPNWPVAPGQENKYGSWCLNANHDMFSGGHGYFDHLLKDERFRLQRARKTFPASYFSLETSRWQILGLDSAWVDGGLAGTQLEWVERRQRENPDKDLLLLTHHQPISAFEKPYPGLQPLLTRNRVTAWFWGHEHRFALYKKRDDLPYPRLIGHSGVPVWAHKGNEVAQQQVEYVSNRSFTAGIEKFALFGFAVLDFEGDNIRARYFDEHGAEERSEIIRPWPKH